MSNVDLTRIASNIGALNSLNSLMQINKSLSNHQTRLSSGRRINSASDDPAGLTIATKMLARSEGMKMVVSNIGDAKNMLSVAESGLSKMNDILIQMRNKAEQAASDTLGSTERAAIATQLSAYANQIDSMVTETKWNSVQLLDGTVNKRFQTGVDDGEYTTWTLTDKFDPTTLGISTTQASDGVANQSATTGIANGGLAATSAFNGLSKLSTGSYQVNITAVATSATVGTAAVLTQPSAASITVGVANSTTAELANGTRTVTFTAYDTTTNTLSFTTDASATVRTQALNTVGATNLEGTGLTVDLGAVNDTDQDNKWSSMVGGSNKTLSVDYVKANNVKYNMKTGSGEVVALDSDGSNSVTTNATSTVAYGTWNTQVDTGRGLKLTFAAAPAVGSTTFDFAQQNNFSVDVSTATKASTYMSTVQSALDKVSSALASLGSLMARMEFKEEQVANSQVNVEASYSRIMNANMAEEQVNASKFAILQQTATAMLAQANQAPQTLLSLFR